jgi:hypothetical protein
MEDRGTVSVPMRMAMGSVAGTVAEDMVVFLVGEDKASSDLVGKE